jgi:hypothetical protein
MTKPTIYTITAVRCILLLLGFLIVIPVWIIHVFSLCVETITNAYLTSLFSFVSSTRDLMAHLHQQLNEEKK